MRDETDFARWGLIGLVIMVVVLAAMKEWYRDRPGDRSSHPAQPLAGSPRPQREPAASGESPVQTTRAPGQSAGLARPVVKDSGIPEIRLADGRTVGFDLRDERDNQIDGYAEAPLTAWIRDSAGQKTPLAPIPSHRQKSTALQLADGRLALLGGLTPRDLIALERKCDDCPEQYIPYGDPVPSTSTDVYDFEDGTWSKGPTAHSPGDFALRLADGRVLKVGVVMDTSLPDKAATDLSIETADAAFTHWEAAGAHRLDNWYERALIFEAPHGAVLLLDGVGPTAALHWQAGRIEPWPEGQRWEAAERIDEGHLRLTRSVDAYPPHSEQIIVELP